MTALFNIHRVITDHVVELHRVRSTRDGTLAVAAIMLAALSALSFARAAEAVPAPPALPFARPTRQVEVLAFGAKGDDASDDTDSFEAALAVEDVVVVVPKGTYIISRPLCVPSLRWINAADDAVIRLADGAGKQWDSFLVTNMDTAQGNHDIVIEGGIWDGNNLNNPRKREYHGRSYGGVLINFTNVNRLALRRLTIRNPESFSVRLGQVEDFVVEDITFDQSHPRPNQDGIHVGGFSHRGLIRRLRVASASGTHDDMVALNADDDIERPFNVGMKCGPITDICVSDLSATEAYTFIRLLSHEHRISNIRIENIRGSFRTNAVNADRWRFPAGGGHLSDIVIRNLSISHIGEKTEPCVTIQSRVDNFMLADVRRSDRDASRNAVPTLVIDNARNNYVTKQAAPSEPEAMPLGPRAYEGVYQIDHGDIASLTISSTASP